MIEFKDFIGLLIGRKRGGKSVADKANWHAEWTIEKYHGDVCPENLYAVEHVHNNKLLNEGITEMLTLLIGGTATPFNNANSYLGIGDSTTAAAATQTGLQAATNKAYIAMDTGYPQVSGQTVTFRGTAGPAIANFAWKEYTIANGNSDSAKNFNRKVEDHGVKTSPDSWVLTCTVTQS